jgi:hypothetical protein
MSWFTFHTYETNAARRKRKKLGDWNSEFATAIWTTKEGRKIKLRDMGDRHLENTIKLITRVAASQQIQDDALFLAGPFPIGDMACMAFDECADAQFERDIEFYLPDIYYLMVDEYLFRGFDAQAIISYRERMVTAAFIAGMRRIRARIT